MNADAPQALQPQVQRRDIGEADQQLRRVGGATVGQLRSPLIAKAASRTRPSAAGSEASSRSSDASSAGLRELALATGLPCAAGFPIGHGEVNEPVPLGARVRLDADACSLGFLEAAVAH